MANTLLDSIACFDLSELEDELITNEFFLAEAEAVDSEIRTKLAKAEEEETSTYEILKALLRKAEEGETSLYETYISSDYYDQFIEYWEIEWKKYYNRYQVFGLGGIYWILDNETQQNEGEYGGDDDRDIYVRYDDAVAVAAEKIQNSCSSYLDHSSNYQEPTVYIRTDVEEYKATHDLAFRPSLLPEHYRGVAPLPKEQDNQEVIRLAFHEQEYANNETDFIERLCQLQMVLSTKPEWREQKLVVAVDQKRLPIDPRRLSQRLVTDLSDHVFDDSALYVWHSKDRRKPLIELGEPEETPYGFEFVLPVTEDRHLNALKVYFLEILQLSMAGTPNELSYRNEICDEELVKLRNDIDNVVLFDESLTVQRKPINDFFLDNRKWNPSIFLATDKPLPKKGSEGYQNLFLSIIRGAYEACKRIGESDAELVVRILADEDKFIFFPEVAMSANVHRVMEEIDNFVNHLSERGWEDRIEICLEGWHQGYSMEVSLSPEMLRFELTDTPADQLAHCFLHSVAETLSYSLKMEVCVGRTDYVEPERDEIGSGDFEQWIHYPRVMLGKIPEQVFIEELAIEVWRKLDNMAFIPVDEAVEWVMKDAELVGRFKYENAEAVKKTIVDTLLWHYCNPTIALHGKLLQRRGTLARAFGLDSHIGGFSD